MKKLPEKLEANLVVILEAASVALRNPEARYLITEDLDLSDEAAEDLLDTVLTYLTEDYAEGWLETHPSEFLSKPEVLAVLRDCSPAIKTAVINNQTTMFPSEH